jgi:hypothetical protein
MYVTVSKHNYLPSQQQVDVTGYMIGDANGDRMLDITDIVYLMNYLFVGGPAPETLAAGDANCDGVVDDADVIYLINYLFASGPAPQCP